MKKCRGEWFTHFTVVFFFFEYEEWFQSLPRDQKQRPVTEKLFGGVAEHIGSEWEMIAVEMDIPKPKREKSVAEHQRSINGQMMEAFTIWKQKHLRPPTLMAFIQILWKCNGRCCIDWEGVEEVVRGDWWSVV